MCLDAAGRELAVIPGEFTGGDVEILRGDLAAILHERTAARCEYRFGDSITALTETAGGVRAEFEHGPAQTFDLVAGADGIHSRVRRLAFGPERDYVRHLGYYYCVAGAPGWGEDSGGANGRPPWPGTRPAEWRPGAGLRGRTCTCSPHRNWMTPAATSRPSSG